MSANSFVKLLSGVLCLLDLLLPSYNWFFSASNVYEIEEMEKNKKFCFQFNFTVYSACVFEPHLLTN